MCKQVSKDAEINSLPLHCICLFVIRIGTHQGCYINFACYSTLNQRFSIFLRKRTPGEYTTLDTHLESEKNILFANIAQYWRHLWSYAGAGGEGMAVAPEFFKENLCHVNVCKFQRF